MIVWKKQKERKKRKEKKRMCQKKRVCFKESLQIISNKNIEQRKCFFKINLFFLPVLRYLLHGNTAVVQPYLAAAAALKPSAISLSFESFLPYNTTSRASVEDVVEEEGVMIGSGSA